jgi:hypothetical protein
MRTRKISFMPHGIRFLLVSLVLAGSFIFPANHLASAHTFSTSESAHFLSLVDQIRAETGLITMNLENNNNNVTLAQAHSDKASSLLNNSTLDEIREVNNRIADNLETGLEQLQGNVTTLASSSQGEIPQDRIQNINQTVVSLNDSLAEAVTVRVEGEQQNNATTWAMALADLVNVVLSNYGNATGAPFDLTNMSNVAGMEGMQMFGNSGSNNTMSMTANATSSMSNMTATIVNVEAYQSAQYLANNTTLRLFNDVLKPLTISANETSSDNNNATPMAQQAQNNVTPANNTTSNIDSLEANLLQLKDDVNGKVPPTEIMTTVHLGIHPILMQLYGLTM